MLLNEHTGLITTTGGTMRHVLWALLFALSTAGASLAAEPQFVRHCQSSDDPSCTGANGRADAAAAIAKGKLGLMVWGGPAAPQREMTIVMEEYKRAGIEVWLTGDTFPSPGEDRYYKGFNSAMEKAIAAKRGPGYLAGVYRRMDQRRKGGQAEGKSGQ